jgi:hypothetical protein
MADSVMMRQGEVRNKLSLLSAIGWRGLHIYIQVIPSVGASLGGRCVVR